MKKWQLKPYQGIDEFKLGSIREHLMEELGLDPETGLRVRKMTDYWPKHHLRFTYNEENRVDSMEVLPPAAAYYDGVEWLQQPYAKLSKELRARDPEVYVIASSLISIKLGLLLRFKALKGDAKPEWVGVFERGFFDSLLEKLQKFQAENQES